MDLDELRDALNEAGRRTDVDEFGARARVGARAQRRRRRQRWTASGVALATTIALVVGAAAIFGLTTHKKVDVTPAGPPPAYSELPAHIDAAMAYDDATSRVVLFGGARPGETEPPATNDTWTWDGHGWVEMHPAVSPPARDGAAMSYDPSTKTVVLFGGAVAIAPTTTAFNDTWTWNGTTWSELHPLHQPPSSSSMAMSYDPASHSILLLTYPPQTGRIVTVQTFQTWRWNGTDWDQLDTTTAPDLGLLEPQLTPLANGGGLLLYSSADEWGSRTPEDVFETWTWDGTRWAEHRPFTIATAGIAVGGHEIVATPGKTAEPMFFDAHANWRWTGSAWARTPIRGDAPQMGGIAVYDAHDHDVVAYGQRLSPGAPQSAVAVYDTWTWNGTWTNRTASLPASAPPVYSAPPTRPGAALAYDDARGQVVLFGGQLPGYLEPVATDQTWIWDGHGWMQMHPAVSPPGRYTAVISDDPGTKTVVLFGGVAPVGAETTRALNDTWTWNGVTWTQQHPRHQPPPNDALAMSYDPRSQSILLLTAPSPRPHTQIAPARFSTWLWNGSDWHQVASTTGPVFLGANFRVNQSPRLTPLANGAGLLFYSWAGPGGEAAADPTGTVDTQTWTWDGSRWTEQHPSRAPSQGKLVATLGATGEPTVFWPDTISRWTGSDWEETPARGPAPPSSADVAVYDARDADVVAYVLRSGLIRSVTAETWTWDGTRWRDRTPVSAPTTTTP